LPASEQQLAAGSRQTRGVLGELFVQAIGGHRADHVRAEHARDRDQSAAVARGLERQLDGATGELRRAMLHTDLRQGPRRRISGERRQHVDARLQFGGVVRKNLCWSLAQQLPERAG
jgi:hypothetical protein